MKKFNRMTTEQENYIWYTLEPIHTFLQSFSFKSITGTERNKSTYENIVKITVLVESSLYL